MYNRRQQVQVKPENKLCLTQKRVKIDVGYTKTLMVNKTESNNHLLIGKLLSSSNEIAVKQQSYTRTLLPIPVGRNCQFGQSDKTEPTITFSYQ